MPDISMCQYDKCEKKSECYRFRAKPFEYQTYCEFKNICDKKNNFKWFWQIKEGDDINEDIQSNQAILEEHSNNISMDSDAME